MPQEPFSCVRERIRSLQDKVSGLEGNNDILPCYSVRTGTVSVNILTEAVDSGTQRMKFFCGGHGSPKIYNGTREFALKEMVIYPRA